jgi:hypothetical protein
MYWLSTYKQTFIPLTRVTTIEYTLLPFPAQRPAPNSIELSPTIVVVFLGSPRNGFFEALADLQVPEYVK